LVKPIHEVYPDHSFYDYRPLIESLGHTILLQVDEGDYQGDSLLILKASDGRYGYLEFGWGSCSGCDALQGCSTWQDVESLRQHLQDSVLWFPTAGELLRNLKDRDWQTKWSYGLSRSSRFLTQAEAILGRPETDANATGQEESATHP
jgi:hypothetical protein